MRFTRREVRVHTGWGDTQLKCHLGRLCELEYLLVHRGGRGQSFVYELLWDSKGRDGSPALSGLFDPAVLSGDHGYDDERSGQNGVRSGSGRPLVGPRSGGGRADLDAENANGHKQSLPSSLPLAAESTLQYHCAEQAVAVPAAS